MGSVSEPTGLRAAVSAHAAAIHASYDAPDEARVADLLAAHDAVWAAVARAERIEAAARAGRSACRLALASVLADEGFFGPGLYTADPILLEDAWRALDALAAALDTPPDATGSPEGDGGGEA